MYALPIDYNINDFVDSSGGKSVVIAQLLSSIERNYPEPKFRPGFETVPESVRGRRRNVEN